MTHLVEYFDVEQRRRTVRLEHATRISDDPAGRGVAAYLINHHSDARRFRSRRVGRVLSIRLLDSFGLPIGE